MASSSPTSLPAFFSWPLFNLIDLNLLKVDSRLDFDQVKIVRSLIDGSLIGTIYSRSGIFGTLSFLSRYLLSKLARRGLSCLHFSINSNIVSISGVAKKRLILYGLLRKTIQRAFFAKHYMPKYF